MTARAGAERDVIDAARDLVALWDNQNIAGLTRQERNAGIASARTKLVVAVHQLEGLVANAEQTAVLRADG